MIDAQQALIPVLAAGAVTFAIRAFPFVMSRWMRQRAWVQTLAEGLPPSLMVIILLHSAWSMNAGRPMTLWVEAVSVVLALGLQWKFKHALVSIVSATGLYVLLRTWMGM